MGHGGVCDREAICHKLWLGLSGLHLGSGGFDLCTILFLSLEILFFSRHSDGRRELLHFSTPHARSFMQSRIRRQPAVRVVIPHAATTNGRPTARGRPDYFERGKAKVPGTAPALTSKST